jgi:formamidopyrimidine-DNA glycosylase
MPELPEVETVRQGLLPVLEGRRLRRVVARRPDLRFPLPERFAERLTGRSVRRLERRAKYLLAHLDGGEVLIMHLGMSGRFSIDGATPGAFVHSGATNGKHDHIVFETDQGARITFTDHRRFGMMDLFPEAEIATYKYLASLGPEPLSEDFSAGYLAGALKGKKTPIKSALLDQTVVAGLGNIYVCEALFRAGISPRRRASTVGLERARRLVPEIKSVLSDAIRDGGSTLRDYKKTSGELGYFQTRFRVYDREGEPCMRRGCEGRIVRIVQSGRSTYFCRKCQT